MSTVRVGLYLRLSLVTEGAGLDRQQEDTERLAEARDWTGRLYIDEASAYKRRTRRPEFERLLSDIAAGIISGVVVYDIDRLARQPRDLERLIDLFDANQRLVFGTCQGDINLATTDGRFMARILVSVANKSSADTGRRVARAHLQKAQRGIPVGGSRPFGWAADKRTLDPIEAQLIQEAAAGILAGKGIHTIAKAWNAAGLTSPRGKPWSKQVLKNLLLSPRLAGYRVYRGEIAVDPSGSPVMGLYDPVLSNDTWQAVKAVLTDPARSGGHVHMAGRKYLLSGLARCGVCGSMLRGNADNRYGNSFNYQCQYSPCGKVGINGPKTDELITKLTLAHLADRRVERSPEVWEHEGELADISQRMADLMSAYTSRQLSGAVVFGAVEQLEQQAAKLRAKQSEWLRRRVQIVPTDVATEWPDLAVEQRRDVIAAALESIAIHPATKRGRYYDPTRVAVWKRSESPQPDPMPQPAVEGQR